MHDTNRSSGRSSGRVSDSVRDLRFSVIRRMSMEALRYPDVITLGIGEPDLHTPRHVCRAALDDACLGHTHYAPSQGDPELIAALAERLAAEGQAVEPGLIQITAGGMLALAAALRTLLEPGDEILTHGPHFSDYIGHAGMARAELRAFPTRLEDDFVPDPAELEAAITPRTKVLLLNSPCNPTGAVIPGHVLDAIAAIVERHDLSVISDEVYDQLTYGCTHESIRTRPGMAERTLVIRSFSKSFAMTGWRVGYCFGPQWLMSHFIKVVSYTTASTSSVGQRAALAAMRGDQGPFQAMRAEFGRRLAFLHERLSAMPGVRVAKPRGAFYLFPRIEQAADSERFALDLLAAEQVVVIPGFAFGAEGEGSVRIAATVPMDKLAQAMDRLERYLRTGGR